uniref:carboxy terminal-processing peptidase n=1 Tax=Thaumasiovibrio occultus TaxID=1891184 RepID=UPI000B362602|nr:carboxy terminal-processing peptidase [Thaumasiovibrio occultus]
MNCRFRFSLMAASMMLAASVQATEATYSLTDLPTLQAEEQHAAASRRVTHWFTTSHYRDFMLDDTFSRAVFDRYVEMLDYNKSFLLQSDIAAFSVWQDKLDEQLENGETEAAFAMFNLAQQRRFERYEYALSLLDGEPMTFDGDDEFVIDRNDMAWPTTQAELNEIWASRVKYDALSLKLAGKEWDEIKETLTKRYNNALKRFIQTRNIDAFQIYMNAFAREVDPHTSYLSPRNAEQFWTEMNLSLEGIGAVLKSEDDYTIIQSLVAGGPASDSNQLSPGDRIIGVGQDKSDIVDVVGWRLDDVVQLIKGPKGSDVFLEILPEGTNSKSYTVNIVRDKIRLEDKAVKSEVLTFGDQRVGIVEIPSFYRNLTADTKAELAKLNGQNVDGIVIDLRNNGGGSLGEAVGLTGLFINAGPVVQVRDEQGDVDVHSDLDRAIYYDGPLTVLINRYSASASEIFAAAMQDYGRAIIVGEQSFGKGTVQQHQELFRLYDVVDRGMGDIQYTTEKFYRINGGSTQHLGVVPDIAFPTAFDPAETGESVEDNALPWDQIEAVDFKQVTEQSLPVSFGVLQRQHDARILGDMEFGFILDDIQTYQEEKDINTISLNYDKRIAEQEQREAERLERVNIRQKAAGLPIFETLDDIPDDYEAPDVYLDEAALITLDMVKTS